MSAVAIQIMEWRIIWLNCSAYGASIPQYSFSEYQMSANHIQFCHDAVVKKMIAFKLSAEICANNIAFNAINWKKTFQMFTYIHGKKHFNLLSIDLIPAHQWCVYFLSSLWRRHRWLFRLRQNFLTCNPLASIHKHIVFMHSQHAFGVEKMLFSKSANGCLTSHQLVECTCVNARINKETRKKQLWTVFFLHLRQGSATLYCFVYLCAAHTPKDERHPQTKLLAMSFLFWT